MNSNIIKDKQADTFINKHETDKQADTLINKHLTDKQV